jgi:putative thioredoxin
MMIDVTDATFDAEVVQRSMTTPVVVDLWAPWCQPCKTLGPMIERVVDETNGKVVLAKVNVDENPQVSQAFRVQSIPAVFALANGQVVDTFVGAQPEPQIREFVNNLIAGEMQAELAALAAAGDEASLRRALEIDPTFKPAAMALAQMLLTAGQATEALAVLEPVPDDDEVTMLADAVRASALPSDERSKIEDRLDELIDQVKGDDDARTEVVELIDELAVGDPTGAADWRKKLSTRLF